MTTAACVNWKVGGPAKHLGSRQVTASGRRDCNSSASLWPDGLRATRGLGGREPGFPGSLLPYNDEAEQAKGFNNTRLARK